MAYFFIENDQLYKKSFALPSLHCLVPREADYVLKEIHEGFVEAIRPKQPSPSKQFDQVITGLE